MSEVNTLKPVVYGLRYDKKIYSDDAFVFRDRAEIELNSFNYHCIRGEIPIPALWEIVPLYPMEWLPVELAPKNVDLLLCDGNGSVPYIAALCGDEWIGYEGDRCDPKYFMLLPEGKDDEA